MSTIVSWFASVLHARSAVLDLLTSGIPREDISAIIGIAQPDAAPSASVQSQLDVSDDEPVAATVNPHDFVTSLFGATTLTLPDIGPVVVAGPLAAALQDSGEEPSNDALRRAVTSIGAQPDQVGSYAKELRQGRALLAIQVDDAQEQIVQGVFRHNLNHGLQEQQERTGPTPSSELADDGVVGPVSTAIGALSNGILPGAWGSGSPLPEDQATIAAHEQNTHERRS